MRTIKFTIVAVMLCASVVTYAKPKKNNKNSSAQTSSIVETAPAYTVDADRTVRNAKGEVVGKIDVEGKIINVNGQVIGRILQYSASNIQEVYSND